MGVTIYMQFGSLLLCLHDVFQALSPHVGSKFKWYYLPQPSQHKKLKTHWSATTNTSTTFSTKEPPNNTHCVNLVVPRKIFKITNIYVWLLQCTILHVLELMYILQALNVGDMHQSIVAQAGIKTNFLLWANTWSCVSQITQSESRERVWKRWRWM